MKTLLKLLPAAGILVLDQLIKSAIIRIPVGTEVFSLSGVAGIVHVKNPGVAFSLLSGRGNLILVLTALMLAGLTLWLLFSRTRSTLWWVPMSMVIGGGLSNLLDRLLLGQVTDYLRLGHFPVFNVADMAVTLGVLVLCAGILFGDSHVPEDKEHEHH